MNSNWFSVYFIYAAAAIVVILWSVLVRCAFGASPFYLARTRWYELPPLRFVFHFFHICVWLGAAVSLAIAVRYGWAWWETSDNWHGITAITSAGAMLFAGLVGLMTLRYLISVPDNRPPEVSIRDVETMEGINPRQIAAIGQEQFPEMVAFGHTSGLRIRGILMTVGFALMAYVIAAATEWGAETGLRTVGIEAICLAREALPPVPANWLIVIGTSAWLGLLLLLFSNATYTLLRFPRTLVAIGSLSLVALACTARSPVSDEHFGMIIGVLSFVFAVRWANDLSRASRFTCARQVTEPIARRLADEVHILPTLKSRPDCRLTPIDESTLRERITRGCRNVEEASLFVTRNLARFLSLVRIEYEHFSAAMLRYLTVRRFVGSYGGSGTSRMLQHPVVPMWNEALFPLKPPSGFANWLDPLLLDSRWDIVSICASCSGSGRVNCSGCSGSGRQQRSESYTEYSGGQSVIRTRYYEVTCSGCSGSGQVTCPTCSGHGRVEYHQTLNTQWQRLQPACTAPHVHVKEFMEGAEERTYYRLPLVEDRTPLAVLPIHDGIEQDLESLLSQVVPALSSDLPQFADSVEQFHGGKIYRADFQVTGFWVLRIRFRRLPGKVGWFFGSRPEFYFPALPLSWGAVSTVLFVLPFVAMTALLTLVTASSFLERILPPLQ